MTRADDGSVAPRDEEEESAVHHAAGRVRWRRTVDHEVHRDRHPRSGDRGGCDAKLLEERPRPGPRGIDHDAAAGIEFGARDDVAKPYYAGFAVAPHEL